LIIITPEKVFKSCGNNFVEHWFDHSEQQNSQTLNTKKKEKHINASLFSLVKWFDKILHLTFIKHLACVNDTDDKPCTVHKEVSCQEQIMTTQNNMFNFFTDTRFDQFAPYPDDCYDEYYGQHSKKDYTETHSKCSADLWPDKVWHINNNQF